MKTFSKFITEAETFTKKQLEAQMNRGMPSEFRLGKSQSGKGSHVTHTITDPKGAEVYVKKPDGGQMTVGGAQKGKGKYSPGALGTATNFNNFIKKVQSTIDDVRDRIPGQENLSAFKQTMQKAREARKDIPSPSNVGRAGRRVLAGILRDAPKSSKPSSSTARRMAGGYSNMIKNLPADEKVRLGNRVLSQLTGKSFTPGSGYRTDRGVGLAD